MDFLQHISKVLCSASPPSTTLGCGTDVKRKGLGKKGFWDQAARRRRGRAQRADRCRCNPTLHCVPPRAHRRCDGPVRSDGERGFAGDTRRDTAPRRREVPLPLRKLSGLQSADDTPELDSVLTESLQEYMTEKT